MQDKIIRFSVIIPVSKKKNRKLLEGCLKSLRNQTLKPFEIILVDKFRKSEARNWGAKKSRGDYLVHIDIDNVLAPDALEKAAQLIKKRRLNTVTLEEKIDAGNIWQRARLLERQIYSKNNTLSTPQIIQKELFSQIGGYDETFNELDDWAFYLRLNKKKFRTAKVKNGTFVYEPTGVVEILTRRFKKGQELSLLKVVYDQIPQVNKSRLLISFFKSWKLILRTPALGICLFFLKFLDFSGILLGTLFPVKTDISLIYQRQSVAEKYNRQQKGFYGTLKHAAEVDSLFKLLPPPSDNYRILELGAGTGRMTRELTKRGYKVTPTDISRAMLIQYNKKRGQTDSLNYPNLPHLPSPILLKAGKLPFKNNTYNSVIALRVFWHIKDKRKREEFFTEAVRVAKRQIIMDFAIKNKGLNFIFNNDFFTTGREIKRMAREHKLSIANQQVLPLGRLLINFTKSDPRHA